LKHTTNALLALAVAGALVLPSWRALGAEAKPVEPVQEWSGAFNEAKDEALQKEAPKEGYLTDEKAWAKLWRAWHGDQKVPRIDFDKQFILVATVECGANRLHGKFTINEDGDLKAVWASTLVAGPGFAYQMCLMDRAGVKSVNGRALDKK
jgi:hypothetical protein